MDALKSGCSAVQTVRRKIKNLAHFKDKEGPKSLAGTQHRVSHRLRQSRLGANRPRKKFRQSAVHPHSRSRQAIIGGRGHSNLAGSEATAPVGLTTIFSTFRRACSSRDSQWAFNREPRS